MIFVTIGKWVILVIACCRLLGEIVQLFSAKLSYFVWENLIEWITYVFSILLVIDVCKSHKELRLVRFINNCIGIMILCDWTRKSIQYKYCIY